MKSLRARKEIVDLLSGSPAVASLVWEQGEAAGAMRFVASYDMCSVWTMDRITVQQMAQAGDVAHMCSYYWNETGSAILSMNDINKIRGRIVVRFSRIEMQDDPDLSKYVATKVDEPEKEPKEGESLAAKYGLPEPDDGEWGAN
jgi:hypothetical protein|tara:strand:- start:8432 stop:8863 length:432 start_codon:yes stop_codon:yes gene_type:complete